MLKLIPRSKKYVDGYKTYCQEYYDHNILTFRPSNPKGIDDSWFDKTYDWYQKKEKGLIAGSPKSFHYWAVDDEKFIGEFQLRPDLNEDLMMTIGSVGYSVSVSEWGKGYGREILKQGLELSKSFNLEKVILIINDDNIASTKLCEASGGVLLDKIFLTSGDEGERLVRRYWIYI